MKKEIDAIRVKDIAQGGLTQGQQTQIARNEQRISQVKSEVIVCLPDLTSIFRGKLYNLVKLNTLI